MLNRVFISVMFCKQFLAYFVHIDWCYHSIHKHSCRSQHTSVLTTCTYITTSLIHRRPFEGQHLVLTIIYVNNTEHLVAVAHSNEMSFNGPVTFVSAFANKQVFQVT